MTDPCRSDRQGGRNEFLILCVGSAGSGLPLLSAFLGVEFCLDFRVRNCNQSPHEICELPKVRCDVLGGRFSQLSSIRRAVAGMRHDYFPRIQAYMLKAFIDDSGSGGDSPWFVLAGYVGTIEAWDAFDEPWLATLKDHGLEYFKASDLPDGEETAQLLDALISVIGKHALRAIYVRLQQRDYDEIIKPYVPDMWQDPYYFLFSGYLSAAVHTEKHGGIGRSTEFYFDSGNKKQEKRADKLYRQCVNLYSDMVEDVKFKDEKIFLPLQAADLLAWQVRRRFSCDWESPRPQFESGLNCPPGKPYSHTITREHLRQLGEAMDQNAMLNWALMGYPEHLRKWRRPKGV